MLTFVSGPTSAIEPTLKTSKGEKGMSPCQFWLMSLGYFFVQAIGDESSPEEVVTSDHQHLWRVTVMTMFSPIIREVPWRKIEDYEAPSSILSNASKIVNFGQWYKKLR